MIADVERFCDSCELCDVFGKPKRQFVLEHVLVQEHFEILSMHLVELKSGKFSFVITIMDVYSRFAFAVPIKNKKSQTVMKAYISTHVALFPQ